jgi:hypothetical protein
LPTAADTVFVGTGAGAGAYLTLPNCALSYSTSTHLFSCASGGTSGGASVGSSGTLQTSDGLGGFSAYTGSNSCGAGFVRTVLPSGQVTCGTPVFPTDTAHLLADRAEPLIPNAVNLGALSSGLVHTATSGGVASLTTVPVPPGGLAGLTGPQILTQTYIPPRMASLATNVTPLVIDVVSTDIAVVSELQQNTLFSNLPGPVPDGKSLWVWIHSTVPRLLTWGTLWSGESGLPLPTTTSGGTVTDALLFQYNPSLTKMVLVYTSQLLKPPVGTSPAGEYTCPATITIDVLGKVTAITSGTCGGAGGGGSTPAGMAGDVQLSDGTSLAADSRSFVHDRATHTTSTPILGAGTGGVYQEFRDVNGFTGWLFPAKLTGNRAWKTPDKSGTLATMEDILAGGSGNVANVGTPVDNQLAIWTDATHIEGVTTLPAGNFPALTGDVTTTAGAVATTLGSAFKRRALVFELGDEQGTALATTAISTVTIPFSCTISAYALTTDAADSTFRVKFWRVADGGTAKPAVGNSISTAGLGVPTGTHVKSTTVTDFTSTAIAAYDTVTMNISTSNTVKYISASLTCDQ